ncbi:MAG: hypothetical protein AB2747_11720 [Candidatus Thiodiazotropha taylori]
MKIACLGWGSLIWDPKSLPIQSQWFKNGPLLPVEFARQSADGRLTLVIEPTSNPVPTLWAMMEGIDLDLARDQLREREGIPKKYIRNIGVWSLEEDTPESIPNIDEWAIDVGVDAVIWTALGPKFSGYNGRVPSIEEAVDYLGKLSGAEFKNARRYVCNAPLQIDTAYRRRFEQELGWKPT